MRAFTLFPEIPWRVTFYDMISILVPKKHLGKSFPQNCRLKKLKAPLLFQAIKPNTDCKIHALKRNKEKTEVYQIAELFTNLCPRNTQGKISHRFALGKA